MPTAYSIGKKTLSAQLRKIAENKNFQNQLFAFSSEVIKYLDYEREKDDRTPVPPLPTLDPAQAKKAKEKSLSSPSVKTPIDEIVKRMQENTEITNNNMEKVFQSLESMTIDVNVQNDSALQEVKASPFMANQVLTKDTLDYISQNMEAQTILLGYLNNTLEKNLSALVGVKIIEAQNAKVNLDKQAVIADNVDNGTFFYAFIPTFDYWAKADLAKYEYDRINNFTTELYSLPSRLYAAGEVSLIDSLEGKEVNSVIRSRVETYRKENLNSGIRALIGQTVIDSARDQTETNAKAKEYYATATESIKAKENVNALESVVAAVAPIAQWAESAKVREDFLTTPRVVVKDLNGVVVKENATPLEITLAKDVALAKGEADENSIGTDTINFLDDLFDDMDISSDFFKRYVRIDEMLQYAKDNPDAGDDGWEQMMGGLFS